MKNYLLIQLTQNIPEKTVRSLRVLKSRFAKKRKDGVRVIENIDHFPTENPKSKRALVTLSPQVWLTALAEHPNIKLYNHSGFVYNSVSALNEAGYIVDLVDTRADFKVEKEYDLFVAHGGGCRPLLDQLSDEIPIYQYISGLYWKVFDEESDARYDRFYKVHGGERPKAHRRSISHMIEGLEVLNGKADVLYSINCPRMVGAYGPYAEKFKFVGLGAFVDPLMDITDEERDYSEGMKNFLYVGGTGGNLQKGIDLLIEAFAELPELNLYLYCKVEEEILKRCRHLLKLDNIHYIYHWRYPIFSDKLTALVKKTNFTVHAPINIGMGTCFMATLGSGMIPVGYIDLVDPGEGAVLIDSWQVEDLKETISRASQKSESWCRKASSLARERYQNFCEPEEVRLKMKEMFAEAKKSKPNHP
jgi:glycosyltransferase involved in cell wall biosynthesis